MPPQIRNAVFNFPRPALFIRVTPSQLTASSPPGRGPRLKTLQILGVHLMRISVAVAVSCLSAMGISTAQDVHAAIRKETTIPAQGLGPALRQLAAERDVQLV